MPKRIKRESPEAEQFNIAAVENVEKHMGSLEELANTVNRAMSAMLAFELRIRFSISELESASVRVNATDLHRPKGLLTIKEVASKLRVPVAAMLRDTAGNYPHPIRGSGRRAMYRHSDVDQWLLGSGPDKGA